MDGKLYKYVFHDQYRVANSDDFRRDDDDPRSLEPRLSSLVRIYILRFGVQFPVIDAHSPCAVFFFVDQVKVGAPITTYYWWKVPPLNYLCMQRFHLLLYFLEFCLR